MDKEEEKVLYLTRVGREKIFKYGTYNVVQQRPITQDHPFYVKRDDVTPHVSGFYLTPGAEGMPQDMQSSDMNAQTAPSESVAPSVSVSDDDPAALADQIISSNFKVGLSQEEVDALLGGMA